MNPLFPRPKNIRYVDMCIEIDNTFYTDDCDKDKCFKYMYLLAYMLAYKSKYFNTQEDYDEFAYFLALSTYTRMSNTEKRPIKSVLNYMKSIMRFRKLMYEKDRFMKIYDGNYSSFDGEAYKSILKSQMESEQINYKKLEVESLISSIPNAISKIIPDRYKDDVVVYSDIYKSVMLTFISRITLPNENQELMDSKIKSKTRFNEINYYKKHVDDTDLVLLHLSDEYSNLVIYLTNKAITFFKNEILEISDSYQISDKIFTDLADEMRYDDYDGEIY